MKATNYQKQELKMYYVKFKENITFKRAEKLLEKARKKADEQKKENIKMTMNWDGK